ncbi:MULTISPECIES: ParA family protein [unclassified Streptomyces]|uniref:ParA family protein n=1 Tax=unclassified Streptomyces TaxID=2593676 RepID=UPI002258742D|nr:MULTISPECIES: ParA family protein [unclassified Streptomyces]MCX4975670.1 ParA family protein [Streptomyces sp. NBC_00620]WTB42176.1 ParA family protein [Streptomyces sp. NBC_00827]WUC10171.1 ParA family protein [Streptomyces sp. NBC_00564]WUC53326.1 ParA family protein [Streptomyces sp. NBC_00554]
MPTRGQGPTGLEAVGSVAVRTFAAQKSPRMTQTAHPSMDGHHVNAMAGNGSGENRTHFADYDELPEGHFYDPDAEYEPDPEYAATLAPDAARQRRERVGPTGRPLPYFPIPGPLTDHGPATIIAMCNQKGGVGKTTSTINLGAALAEYGRRVLLVDFDPQGALSVGLGVNPMELDLTVYNLLMERGMVADDVLLKTAVPNMDLLPSNIDLSAAEVQLVSEVARESTLQRALKPLMADYDYIVIDCQPSLGLLTVNALTAAHKVIVPLECEFFALRGVALLTETIEKVQERLNPELELDGILATMYDSRTVHSREVLARVVEAFDDHVYHTVIGRTVRFPETTVAGEPITTYASNSVGAAAYRQLAREVLARCHAE